MSEKLFLFQTVFTYFMFVLFLYFTFDSVAEAGWDFFSIIFAAFATNNFVRATRMTQIYIRIKRSQKP